MTVSRWSLLILFFASGCLSALAQEKNPIAHSDLLVATVDGHELRLNLFLPQDVENPPLVIYIHGGGWSKGSYKKNLVPWIPEHGFALASIGYRLTDVATFPAQIHDVKAAVRWLRAHAKEYGYDATRIGVCGTSAGGHLAMLLGMTGGVAELEGKAGEHLGEDSRVQAIVDYYGASDFALRSRTQPAKTEQPDGSAYRLLGGKASEQPEKAKLASPAFHVTGDDPPLLILHGENDRTVLLDQSERIRDAYQSAGLECEYHPIADGRHGGAIYFTEPNRKLVTDFFAKHLQP